MIDRDIAIVICSRGREALLRQLLRDLDRAFAPALKAAGLTHCIWVYAQGYAREYLVRLACEFPIAAAAQNLVVCASMREHSRIGDVVHTAVQALHANVRYRLAMIMDDDSVYESHSVVDANVRNAALHFLEYGHRAYSIKLGASYALDYQPFIDPAGPIMPFKEKMLWASREVLDEVLRTPRFPELSIGEDAVIAAVAWLARPDACFGVYGMATFLHLAYERSPAFAEPGVEGGYAELMNYKGLAADSSTHGKYDEALRTGVTPHHIMPAVFVSEDHPHYIFNGVRTEVVDGCFGRASCRGHPEVR
jgi:hypothetical protein